jgi:integrase
VTAVLPVQDDRARRDRLEVLTALISAPSFEPLFRAEIINIPLGHPVYRWECLVTCCERPRMGHGDLCSAHLEQWRHLQQSGEESKAVFLRAARPVGLAAWAGERPCRICPQRPARNVTLVLCDKHQFRWYRRRKLLGDDAGFDDWLAGQAPYPGYGCCRVQICPELANSPLGLCARHESRYRSQGSPGEAALPVQWSSRYERPGRTVPVAYADEGAFRRWCATAVPVLRSAQVNLRGLHPLLRAEIQWGLFAHTQKVHSHWELPWVQELASYCRERDLRSLAELDPEDDAAFRRAVGREVPAITREILRGLRTLYVTPEETREQGYILTEHFGRRLTGRPGRIDLTRVSQRWLRDLLWDHFADVLRSPRCPRSARPFDGMRRAGLELSAFLEIRAPGGGHDPTVLTQQYMQQFAADQRQREQDGLPSLGFRGRGGKPSIVTANTRQAVFHCTRRLFREALESGETERLGLDRSFITAMPPAGALIRRARSPFPDGVARALADDANLRKLAGTYDPCDRGLRDAWETIIVTGRRCSEVLNLRLDCLGRYGGLPMLWHDQTKVGNYDQALRIPERLHQLLEARQRKTVALFTTRHNRPPTPQERAHLALFPTSQRNSDGRRPLSYKWFHKGFKLWVDELDIGRWVPHQARHSLATSLLRAGATLTHIRRYLGQVSERMAEHYVHLTQSDLENVLQRVWVAGPGSASPGELLTGDAVPLTREHAQALAIDLSRRSTPAEGGFCTFQPVVDGGNCPWNLNCHSCDKFVLSGADLLYWRRKREQWRLLAEGAPDDATAAYLHDYFEPTARAIDGLEKALAGLGLLDDALALDLRKPQDYFRHVWSTAFRAADLAAAGAPDGGAGEADGQYDTGENEYDDAGAHA